MPAPPFRVISRDAQTCEQPSHEVDTAICRRNHDLLLALTLEAGLELLTVSVHFADAAPAYLHASADDRRDAPGRAGAFHRPCLAPCLAWRRRRRQRRWGARPRCNLQARCWPIARTCPCWNTWWPAFCIPSVCKTARESIDDGHFRAVGKNNTDLAALAIYPTLKPAGWGCILPGERNRALKGFGTRKRKRQKTSEPLFLTTNCSVEPRGREAGHRHLQRRPRHLHLQAPRRHHRCQCRPRRRPLRSRPRRRRRR